MSEQTNSPPAGYTTVATWAVTDDTGAFLDFVSRAFGGEELARVPTEDGLIGHGEIRVGDTVAGLRPAHELARHAKPAARVRHRR